MTEQEESLKDAREQHETLSKEHDSMKTQLGDRTGSVGEAGG